MPSKTIDDNPVTGIQMQRQVRLSRHAGSTVCVLGPSGVGKSQMMEEAALESFEDVWLSNFSDAIPSMVTGLGLPVEGGTNEQGEKILDMLFSQPKGVPTVERVGAQHLYWILDDFPHTDPEVRAAFHPVLAPTSDGKRYLGTHLIGPNVKIGITGNRKCDTASNIKKFSLTEIRRTILMTMIPDPGEWWRWGDSIEEYAKTKVPAFIAYGNSVGAKQDHQNHFLGNPGDFDPYMPSASPCPRQWEEVMKILIIRSKNMCERDDCQIAIQGLVGAKATRALKAFLAVNDSHLDFKKLKADPKGYPIPKEEMQQFSLASGAMLYATAGITDIPAALHSGEFDWVFDCMERFSPEVGAYGLATAERRGIDVPSRRPELWADLVGA